MAGLVDVVDEPVAVGVAVVQQPVQCAPQRGEELAHLLFRHPGSVRVGQEAHPQRGRIDRAVVDRRQHDPLAGHREGLAAQLVQDLAGLLRGLGVGALALEAGEDAKGGCRDPVIHGEGEPCRPERIAAEEREEPGRTGGEELLVGPVGKRETQCVEVRQGGVQPPLQSRVSVHARHGPPRRGPHASDDERRVMQIDRP